MPCMHITEYAGCAEVKTLVHEYEITLLWVEYLHELLVRLSLESFLYIHETNLNELSFIKMLRLRITYQMIHRITLQFSELIDTR